MQKKKITRLLLTGVVLTIFTSVFITGCSQGTTPDSSSNQKKESETEKENESEKGNTTQTGTGTKTEPEKKDSVEVKLGQYWADDATYNRETSIITLPCDFKSITFPFSDYKNLDASDFNYVELSYSGLTNPVASFSVVYSDDSYSTVYLQSHLNKIYLKLDASRKKEIKQFKFMNTRTSVFFKEDAAFKLESIKLLKEKPADEKQPKAFVDVLNGKFSDSISAMDLSKQIAVGWNASRLASCPYYGEKDVENLVYGLQEEYISENNTVKKYLGTSAQGLALESALLPAENRDHLKAGLGYGFKSLRVNVTWFAHIIDDKYTIDPYWMARVKEVVDWAIQDGYYVVLNDHHSVYKYNHDLTYGKGYNLDNKDKAESERFLTAIWTQIATAFNGSYDEHLIFETLNEPRRTCSVSENSNGELWTYQLNASQKKEYVGILNEYNQLIVNAIRKTGGNNSKRFIMVPSYATDVDTVFDTGFTLPKDTASDKLMVAIHWYPMMVSSEVKTFDENLKNKITNSFAKVYTEYTSKGIPFCLTEFMIQNLGSEGALFDKNERYNCLKYFCEYAGKNRISMMAWDDGMAHGVVERKAPYKLTDGDTFFPDLIKAWEKGWKEGPEPAVKNLAQIWTEKNSKQVSLLDEGKTLIDWGEANSRCIISAEKLTGIKENCILKLSIEGNNSFKNFAFFTIDKDYNWVKIPFEGEKYSEKGYYSSRDDNFNFESENSPLFIKLTAKDVENLKNGFFISGMNVTISGIWWK